MQEFWASLSAQVMYHVLKQLSVQKVSCVWGCPSLQGKIRADYSYVRTRVFVRLGKLPARCLLQGSARGLRGLSEALHGSGRYVLASS